MGSRTNSREREECCREAGQREELLEAGNGEARFRVCSAGFQSDFGLVFPQHDPIHPFWNGHTYSGHCMLEVWNSHSDFTGSSIEDTVWSLRRDSGL